jgi:hypothetical protein
MIKYFYYFYTYCFSGKFPAPRGEIAEIVFNSIMEHASKLCMRPGSAVRVLHIVDVSDAVLKLIKTLFDDVTAKQGRHVIVAELPRDEVQTRVKLCRTMNDFDKL